MAAGDGPTIAGVHPACFGSWYLPGKAAGIVGITTWSAGVASNAVLAQGGHAVTAGVVGGGVGGLHGGILQGKDPLQSTALGFAGGAAGSLVEIGTKASEVQKARAGVYVGAGVDQVYSPQASGGSSNGDDCGC
jgi:hypothetical protein